MVPFILLLASAVQTAPTPAPTPVEQKQICKRRTNAGSRIGGKRICRTKAEWDEEARMARDDVDANRRQ